MGVKQTRLTTAVREARQIRLRNSQELGLSRECVTEALSRLGKGESIRGEALTLEEFAALANHIYDRLQEET